MNILHIFFCVFILFHAVEQAKPDSSSSSSGTIVGIVAAVIGAVVIVVVIVFFLRLVWTLTYKSNHCMISLSDYKPNHVGYDQF